MVCGRCDRFLYLHTVVDFVFLLVIPPLHAFIIVDSVTITGSVIGAGTATQTINGNSLYLEKSTMNITASSKLGDISATLNLSYAPSIGFIVSDDLSEQGSAAGLNLSGGVAAFLRSYTLK